MEKPQQIAINSTKEIGFRAKISANVYDDISLYENIKAYVVIGANTYKYSRETEAEHEPFYSQSQTLAKILVGIDKTGIAKDGEYLKVTWLIKKADPLNIGEYFYEPVLEQVIGIFKKNIAEV